MPEVALGNNKKCSSNNLLFFFFPSNDQTTPLLISTVFLGVKYTFTSTLKQICTSSWHISAICQILYAAQKRLFPFPPIFIISLLSIYASSIFYCYLALQIEGSTRLPLERELAKIRPMVQLAASTVQGIRDRCGYGWVQLQDFIITV